MSVNPAKDRPRCSACNKKQYTTKAAAHVVMRATVRSNKRHGISTCLHVYHCPDCKQYHVGHTTPTKGKRVKVAKHSPRPAKRSPDGRVAAGIAHVVNNWHELERKAAKSEMVNRMKAMRVAA